MQPRFNTTALEALAPKKRPYKLSIGGSVALIVNPNGSKWWRYRYRIDGKEQTLSLGVFPSVSVEAAIKAADQIKRQLRAGRNPSIERLAQKAARAQRIRAERKHLQITRARDGGLILVAQGKLLRLSKTDTRALRAFLGSSEGASASDEP